MLAFPKTPRIVSKKFRKWIAEQPCMKCKVEGRTQAAHLGKGGIAMKGHDYTCAPLCTVSPGGDLGCHEKLDRHLEIQYWRENKHRATATTMRAYGLWLEGYHGEAEQEYRDY